MNKTIGMQLDPASGEHELEGSPVPEVSVVIPVFNGARFVAKAMSSVLGQTMEDLELIVVDDGSTDDTAAIVRCFSDGRIRYHYQKNRGLSAARNTGVRLACAPWVAFLDCDDYWRPGKLAAQLARAREAPEAALIYCGAALWDIDGEHIQDFECVVEGDVLDQLLLGNRISGSASSALVRRDVLQRVGLFDERLSVCEDWDLWLRIAAVAPIARVPQQLVCIRGVAESLGSRPTTMRDAYFSVLRRALAFYPSAPWRVRRRALASAHKTAAVNFQEAGSFVEARRELLKTIWYRPLNPPMYWRLARALLGHR